jgi:hypothetical protein
MSDETVTLYARRWVQLPGTDFEVLLHGKAGELMVRRTGGRFGGWSLPYTVYVRWTDPSDGEES